MRYLVSLACRSQYNSNPVGEKVYHRFDENNFFNKYPYLAVASSRSKEELNSDLYLKAENVPQSNFRIKTTIGRNRSTSPQIDEDKNSLMKPNASLKGAVQKKPAKGKLSKYLVTVNL